MSTQHQTPSHGDVIDIGGSRLHEDVGERLAGVLTAVYGPSAKPTLPDELLYTDVGLPIWNEIIFTPEFYQTHDEIALFDAHGSDIIKRLQPGVTMIDLGVGDTRKVEHLLSSFEEAQLEATYLALDISKTSLEHSIGYLLGEHSAANAKVTCAGLWGTFQDGMSYVKGIQGQRLFLSLGSVLCNDPWAEALNHLRYWAEALRPGDLLLVGMDAHLLPNDNDKIWKAYHSQDDLYRQFFLNGFNQVNKAIGEEWFQEEDWEFMAQLEDQPTTRHRFFFRAKKDVIIHKLNRTFKAGEELDWFDSHKYGEESVRLMCHKAGLSVINVMQAPGSEFRQYLLKAKDEQDQREDGDSAISGLV
ncbi:histidine-specific methyltransferase [Trichoderma evansii]